LEKPNVFLQLVWTFAPNALPQAPQIFTVKLAIDGLTRGYEFLVDNALDIEKNPIKMDLTLLRTWRSFFRPRWIWRLPLRRLLLCLRLINIHQWFNAGYDIGDEVGVVSGLLFDFPSDRKVKDFLVVAQQSWRKSRRIASHVQFVRQNALNGPVW